MSSVLSMIEQLIRDGGPVQTIQRAENYRSLPRVDPPEEGTFSVQFFPHQLVSVYNMEQLERVRMVSQKPNPIEQLVLRTSSVQPKVDQELIETKVGIFADQMGSGKSLSLILLLLRDKMEFMNLETESIGTNILDTETGRFTSRYHIQKTPTQQKVNTTIIVMGSSIIHQWVEYFGLVKTGLLSVVEISTRKHLEEFVIDPPSGRNPDVILLSTCRYNEFMIQHGRSRLWKRVILDDIVSTPVPSMMVINTHFVWIVSATYQDITSYQNRNGMMARFAECYGTTMTKLVIKNDIEFIKQSFVPPEIREVSHRYFRHRILGVIGNYISNDVRDMISSGDFQQAIRELGGGVISSKNNLMELISRKHKNKLFECNQHLDSWKRRESQNPSAMNHNEVLVWTKRVADQEKIIQELDNKYKEMVEDICPICLDQSEQKILLSCCQNITCCACIMKWMETKKSCPLCRSAITHHNLTFLDEAVQADRDIHDTKEDDSKEDEAKEEELSKEETIVRIIEKGRLENKKILVFSAHDFGLARNLFKEKNIAFSEMSGTKATRERKIRDYKSGKIPVIFLNSDFSGAGINLTETDEIIFYSNVLPSVKQQNIGRAMRIGRNKALVIHTFVEK